MKKMNEVDVVLVGAGWTGGILGKELSEAGMTVVCLERGGPQSSSATKVARSGNRDNRVKKVTPPATNPTRSPK